MIRHQPPVFSPLPLQAVFRAFVGRLQSGENPLTVLSELLAEERGAERVILYGSGTQALQVALRAAVDTVGGAVALPAYSCFDVATAAVAAKVPVRFYDVEPETLGARSPIARGRAGGGCARGGGRAVVWDSAGLVARARDRSAARGDPSGGRGSGAWVPDRDVRSRNVRGRLDSQLRSWKGMDWWRGWGTIDAESERGLQFRRNGKGRGRRPWWPGPAIEDTGAMGPWADPPSMAFPQRFPGWAWERPTTGSRPQLDRWNAAPRLWRSVPGKLHLLRQGTGDRPQSRCSGRSRRWDSPRIRFGR